MTVWYPVFCESNFSICGVKPVLGYYKPAEVEKGDTILATTLEAPSLCYSQERLAQGLGS